MTLFEKFIIFIKKKLNNFDMTDFSAFDDLEIIALNFNIKSKLIFTQKYSIKESSEVMTKISLLAMKYKNAYQNIKNNLENGIDVNPFLSKLAIKPKNQDYLLLDWNIHHFHLNKNNSNTYFNERSDYLLMVQFKDNIAHFIDIELHRDNEVFVKKEYLKIIKDNWSYLLEPCEVHGGLDLNINPTNDDIKQFRKNQINTFLKIDDKIYGCIGGGITMSGIGEQHILDAMKWKKLIDQIEKEYSINQEDILNSIYKQTGKKFISLDLDFIYYDNHLVLIEKNSNLILQQL